MNAVREETGRGYNVQDMRRCRWWDADVVVLKLSRTGHFLACAKSSQGCTHRGAFWIREIQGGLGGRGLGLFSTWFTWQPPELGLRGNQQTGGKHPDPEEH